MVLRIDQYKTDASWMRMQALQVAGPGQLSGVAVRRSAQQVSSILTSHPCSFSICCSYDAHGNA